MVTGINESKTLTKHILCNCRCKFDSRKCNSNQKWNNDKCQSECKKLINITYANKIILGMLTYVVASIALFILGEKIRREKHFSHQFSQPDFTLGKEKPLESKLTMLCY